MKCPNCNTDVTHTGQYCRSCGYKLNSTPSSTGTGSQPQTSSSLVTGARLQGGRYVVKQILGQGGMGAALLATDIRLDGKLVVIKELLSSSSDPTSLAEDVRNFKREVATLAHIDHPLVPNVTDHFQEGAHYFMVQEYVEGENLEVRLAQQNQPLRERDVLICASELLDVLDYLGQKMPPIIHRDIKPANIIVGVRDKKAHLVDFGIARADEAKKSQLKQTSALGTPGYAPPEQYQSNADPRSDLYALAATLHHLATNRDPRNHPPFQFPLARMINPQISPEFEQVLVRALNNDRNQRYQSAAAFKQDIDSILRTRFGLSGSLDSYTLGVSGTPQTLQSTAAALAVPPVPVTPLQPMPTPISIAPTHAAPTMVTMPPPPKRRKTGLFVLLTLLLIFTLVSAGVGATVFWPRGQTGSSTPTVSPTPASAVSVKKLGNESIGISDGRYAFDTTLPNGSLKTQAATVLQKDADDTNTALSLLNEAVGKNSNDAEALIYRENIRVTHSGSSYITVVVATMLSGRTGEISVGRDNLQGAYVAQKEFNDSAKLQNGIQVRVLIANSGSKKEYTVQVAQQIVRLAQQDKTFVGVMGWPYSDRSGDAIKILGSARIPMLSQTASSDLLTGISPYFFRVVPPNDIQAQVAASYARNTLKVKNVALFYDQANLYSQTLAQNFKQHFTEQGGTVSVEKQYTIGQARTIAEALQDALKTNPDMLYFAGYAADISTLLSNLPDGDMPVLGGDSLYELGGYESSGRIKFSRLTFTAFAYPDEWGVLGYNKQEPSFFKAYIAAFDPYKQHPGYGFTRATNNTILSYDAMVTLLTGCDNVLRKGKQTVTPQDLREGLLAIDENNALQGVSGRIAFGKQGDPLDKVVVLLHVDSLGRIYMDPAIVGRFLK